ncbi:MAG: hypothetical protein QOI23_55, partial [Chloroflexota bacterium]|nr:hypothetical protein [Chloroflexota bacterium]
MSSTPIALGGASWPRSRQAFARINPTSAHRAALAMSALAVASLPWLHPSGPGNSSPTDVAIVGALAAVAVWAYVSRELIRAPFGISVGLLIVAGCISGVVGPYLRGSLVTIG